MLGLHSGQHYSSGSQSGGQDPQEGARLLLKESKWILISVFSLIFHVPQWDCGLQCSVRTPAFHQKGRGFNTSRFQWEYDENEDSSPPSSCRIGSSTLPPSLPLSPHHRPQPLPPHSPSPYDPEKGLRAGWQMNEHFMLHGNWILWQMQKQRVKL